MTLNEISIHDVTKIKSSIIKYTTDEGRIFFVRSFYFTDKYGDKIEIKAFGDWGEDLNPQIDD